MLYLPFLSLELHFVSYFANILLYDEIIPHMYKADVAKRVNDWIKAGGKETDPYIATQYNYLLRVRDMIQNKNIAK